LINQTPPRSRTLKSHSAFVLVIWSLEFGAWSLVLYSYYFFVLIIVICCLGFGIFFSYFYLFTFYFYLYSLSLQPRTSNHEFFSPPITYCPLPIIYFLPTAYFFSFPTCSLQPDTMDRVQRYGLDAVHKTKVLRRYPNSVIGAVAFPV
jgi:hypothetical protein